MICQACSEAEHSPHECANNDAPMCDRACSCGCGRVITDPAPYWSGRREDSQSMKGIQP